MAKEIERKFLVISDSYKGMAIRSHAIVQGYLSEKGRPTLRARLRDDEAFLTIKGPTEGFSRDEWEYPIPPADAREMIDALADGRVIEKTRYIVPYEGHTWEVDEFHGRHAGLVLAEIELTTEEEPFTLPPFVGHEVTGDKRYYNARLARKS